MDYEPEQFLKLIEAVEEQAGAVLPDACEPKRFQLNQPKKDGSENIVTLATQGCGKHARFMIQYSPTNSAEPKFITLCAYCDNVGAMPRFREALR